MVHPIPQRRRRLIEDRVNSPPKGERNSARGSGTFDSPSFERDSGMFAHKILSVNATIDHVSIFECALRVYKGPYLNVNANVFRF